jgi:hypothetical protein
MRIPDIRDRADEALEIIQEGPIHLDDLAMKLHTSKIQAGYIVNELRNRGEGVCFKEETVYIPTNQTTSLLLCSLCLTFPILAFMFWG